MGLVLTSSGLVANFVQGSQFEAGETEFACGFFAVAECHFATPPSLPNKEPFENIDTWADHEYDVVYTSHDASQQGGMGTDALHNAIQHAGNLHYWDITSISFNSAHDHDIAEIKAALAAGYPVISYIVEASVNDLTGDIPAGNPYEWNPKCDQNQCWTHIIIYAGIAHDGNLLVIDYANVVGPLQGNNTVRPWPRKYDVNSINNQLATVIQLVGPDPQQPWLKSIPNDDPLTWPQAFNAQNFMPEQPGVWVNSHQEQQAKDTWNATNKLLQLTYGATAPYTTGIAQAWQQEYMKGNNFGPPLTLEFGSVDWSGTPIQVQVFAGKRAEWNDAQHTCLWYSS